MKVMEMDQPNQDNWQ
ncbi:hypothetical protein VYM69_17750, partial [Bacillus safensis]|nr:hypothetical protein [Bacillus safensis]